MVHSHRKAELLLASAFTKSVKINRTVVTAVENGLCGCSFIQRIHTVIIEIERVHA